MPPSDNVKACHFSLVAVCARHGFMLVTILFLLNCSKKSGGDDSSETSSGTTAGTVAIQPNGGGGAAPNSGGGAAPISGGGSSNGTSVVVAGTIAISGTDSNSGLQLTGDSGSNSLSSYTVKGLSADSDTKTCSTPVAADGTFAMDCDGFHDKRMIAAIYKTNEDGDKDLVAFAADLGGVNSEADNANLDVLLDPTIGAVDAMLDQFKSDQKVEAVAALPPELTNLSLNEGMFELNRYLAPNDNTSRTWKNWDLSTLPNKSTRATNYLNEAFYLRFTPASSDAVPRLAAWETKADADACSSGVAVKDGTSTLTNLNFAPAFSAINSNGWAPAMAIDQYLIAASNINLDTQSVGYRQADMTSRQIVEQFFVKSSEWRRSHRPEDRFIALQRAFAALAIESDANAVTDFTRAKTARSWAYVTTDASLRRLLILALAKWDQADASNFGGNTGKQYIDARLAELLAGTGGTQTVLDLACNTDLRMDFIAMLLNAGGLAAVDTYLTAVEPPSPQNGLKYSLKTGYGGTARAMLANFLSTAIPLTKACTKFVLAGWLNEITNIGDNASKEQKAKNYIAAVSATIDGARINYALYNINLRDPNGDGFTFAFPGAPGTGYTALNQAELDITALGDKIGDVLAVAPHFVNYMCADIVRYGGTPSECFGYLSTPLSTANAYRRLFSLQGLISEMAVNAAYEFEPAFRSKLSSIYANSGCLPTAWVGWEPDTSQGNVSFEVTVEAPAALLFDAPINIVPKNDSLVFIADGSRLQNDSYWDAENLSTRPCTRGDVKILSHLQFDASKNLVSGLFRDGYKDTCVQGGENQLDDWTTISFIDLEPVQP